ncbi:MAG TPA: hypothetical protein PLH80_03865 [Spirochaetota bacterium]|nr:hypothetical protein [Spirochaetota bacterium]HOF13504.1 hypothetical protein [Spirochaetota bacterium]HOM87696.1 hypothetical protein [Spirochaetota bacterium]HOR92963.1 hypothetical protein [Spirochaetota bacterium]HOT19333.1 hypothetical protein [Spirochaetota bacterium]
MRASRYLSEKEMLQKGIDVLLDALGPVETVRFLNISRDKRIESVKRHRMWQKSLKKDDFINEIVK